LPGMDGYEALGVLSQSQATKNIPVLAISANAMAFDIGKGLKAGFKDYITKPIDVAKFLKVIDRYLEYNA